MLNINNNPEQQLHNCTLHTLQDLQVNPPEPVTIKTTDEVITFTSEQLAYRERAFLKSVLGLEEEAQREFDAGRNNDRKLNRKSNLPAPMQINLDELTQFDAISQIVTLSKHHQVVMINEAHHISLHRHFASKLASALRKAGFTHLAAETFYNAELIEQLNYPTAGTGFYLRDPEFGQFIRSALSEGYQLVKYEASGKDREQEQAENLAAFLKTKPDAKLLVFAGYAHIRETAPPNKSQWMAYKFKKLTGIDPLTIDQVGGTANYEDALTDPVYKTIEPKLNHSSSVFAYPNKGWLVSSKYAEKVDLTVFHQRTTKINQRPHWLANDSSRKLYKLEQQDLPPERPIAVKAIMSNEWLEQGIKSIPVDQILLRTKQEEANLYLPSGNYHLLIDSTTPLNLTPKVIQVLQ